VFCVPKGKITLYASTKRFSDEFQRLAKIHPTTERPEVHGITLKLEAKELQLEQFTNALPVGGVVRERGWDGVGGVNTGETSFQLSRCTLMVYLSCSLAPLDYDGWLQWLKQVDGYLLAKKWPRLLGENFRFWVECQLGINFDEKNVRVDSFTEAISLQVFDDWFARCYRKTLANGENVVRSEVHVKGERSLEKMVQAMAGNMHSVMVDNKVDGAAEAVNNNTATLGAQQRKLRDIEKKIDSLKTSGVASFSSKEVDGAIYNLEFKLDSLKHDFNEFKNDYCCQTSRLVATNEGLTGMVKELLALLKGAADSSQVQSNEVKIKGENEFYVR
jgi:hypothetical protein